MLDRVVFLDQILNVISQVSSGPIKAKTIIIITGHLWLTILMKIWGTKEPWPFSGGLWTGKDEGNEESSRLAMTMSNHQKFQTERTMPFNSLAPFLADSERPSATNTNRHWNEINNRNKSLLAFHLFHLSLLPILCYIAASYSKYYQSSSYN